MDGWMERQANKTDLAGQEKGRRMIAVEAVDGLRWYPMSCLALQSLVITCQS